MKFLIFAGLLLLLCLNHRKTASLETSKDPCQHISHQEDACSFVRDNQECGRVAVLLNYLQFQYCDLSHGAQPLGYIILLVWLVIVVKVLGSTAETFFLPPLEYLSRILNLSDGVAGVTLFALGNGANDVFMSIAGLHASDFPLVLGGLIGAGICLTTFVLGCVLLVAPSHTTLSADQQVKKADFWRDSIVYLLATTLIAGIAMDLRIFLWESVLFLLLYLAYVVLVLVMDRRKQRAKSRENLLPEMLSEEEVSEPPIVVETGGLNETDVGDPADRLEGISWIGWKAGPLSLILYFVEWPFFALRWLSIPSTNEQWGKRRRLLNAISPFFVVVLFFLSIWGIPSLSWRIHEFPVILVIGIVSLALTVVILLTSTPERLPVYHSVFGVVAFVSAISWLKIIASECVAILETLGIELSISTGILGATLLAIGDSMNDLAADTTVSRLGRPAMACGACFGAPLLTNMLGLGLSLTITTASSYPEPFRFDKVTHQLYLTWGYLLGSLAINMIVFPLSNYMPSKKYGICLVVYYFTFLIASVLVEKFFK